MLCVGSRKIFLLHGVTITNTLLRTNCKQANQCTMQANLFFFCMFLYVFCRIEHEKLHAKHKGHEAMHMEMILILFSTLIVAQVLLVKWKKHYYKSFQVKKKTTTTTAKLSQNRAH